MEFHKCSFVYEISGSNQNKSYGLVDIPDICLIFVSLPLVFRRKKVIVSIHPISHINNMYAVKAGRRTEEFPAYLIFHDFEKF